MCRRTRTRVLGSPVTGSSHDIPKCFPPSLCSSSCAVSRLTRPFPILHPRISIPLPGNPRRAVGTHRMQPCVIRHDLCFLPRWHYARPGTRDRARYLCARMHLHKDVHTRPRPIQSRSKVNRIHAYGGSTCTLKG